MLEYYFFMWNLYYFHNIWPPIIKIQYEKGIASVLPNYELILKENGNKNVDETKKLTFTASVTDSSIENLEYSLSNQPNGATIDKDSGIFTWTPTSSQSGNYILDIWNSMYNLTLARLK